MLKLFKKLPLFLLAFLFICSGYSFKSKAKDIEFTHSINAHYEIDANKKTKVEFKFSTTNKIPNNYLQAFSFKLPFEPLNISSKGSPTNIKIDPVKKITTGVYSLDIEILNSVYGLNRKFDWQFSFEVNDLVLNHGLQKAIVIPNFNDEPDISEANINIKIPDSLGEIEYIYGNAKVSHDASYSNISYVKEGSISSNVIVLLGERQEFSFEVNNIKKQSDIYLPFTNSYQEAVYSKFPERTTNLDVINNNKFSLKPNEEIKGVIRAQLNHDTIYSKEFDDVSNKEIATEIINNLQKDKIDKKDYPKKAFERIVKEYTLSDVNTSDVSKVSLSLDKKSVIPIELNKIFRDVLTMLNIENRGVYGYVFPIQPFARNEFIATQHVWSEYWDGNSWIVVDPTWYIASKGTDYYDKNSFHHIKFGSYHNFDDIKDFFTLKDILSIIPLKERSDIIREEKVGISAYDSAFLNKQFKLVIENNSNFPVRVGSLTTSIDISKIKLQNSSLDLDRIINPNDKVEISIPLKYGLIFKNTDTNLKMNIKYYSSDNKEINKTFNHTMKIKTNFSGYLIYIILGLSLLIISVLPLGLFGLHRLRKRNKK